MHTQEVIMSLVFPPCKCDTCPGKNIEKPERTRKKAPGVNEELRDTGRQTHSVEQAGVGETNQQAMAI